MEGNASCIFLLLTTVARACDHGPSTAAPSDKIMDCSRGASSHGQLRLVAWQKTAAGPQPPSRLLIIHGKSGLSTRPVLVASDALPSPSPWDPPPFPPNAAPLGSTHSFVAYYILFVSCCGKNPIPNLTFYSSLAQSFWRRLPV